jgi:glycosyltransferase involved in cell wall biosynthesis
MVTDAKDEQTEYESAGAAAALEDGALPQAASSAPAVTMLCWHYYPLPGGGADRVMQQVAEFLVRRGWRVSVLTRTFPRISLPRREVVNGVEVYRVRTLAIPRLRFVSYLSAAFLRQLFRRSPGQVLHVNQFYLHVPMAIWLGRLRGMRVVVGAHGSGVAGDMQRLGRLPLGLGGWILRAGRQADAIISLTSQMTRELLAAGLAPERVVQISNGVDCARFAPAAPERRAELRAQLGLPPDRPIVLFAGRFSSEKAIDVLLRAWQRLRERCPDALLVLAGTGRLLAEMQALSHELGLDEAARFLGWTDQTLPLYQAADLFVLTSWSEGMSIALLEAMACGLPPVATAIPGNTDLVTPEENGLLFAPGDEAGLAEALERGLSDVALRARLAEAARETITSRFSVELMTQRYARLYQQVWEQRQQEKKRYEL